MTPGINKEKTDLDKREAVLDVIAATVEHDVLAYLTLAFCYARWISCHFAFKYLNSKSNCRYVTDGFGVFLLFAQTSSLPVNKE